MKQNFDTNSRLPSDNELRGIESQLLQSLVTVMKERGQTVRFSGSCLPPQGLENLRHLLPHDVSNLVRHITHAEILADPELRGTFTIRPCLVAKALQLSTAPLGHSQQVNAVLEGVDLSWCLTNEVPSITLRSALYYIKIRHERSQTIDECHYDRC